LSNTKSKLLSIIANTRGTETACNFDEINYLGFPLSVSEQFQKRNTNKSIEEALNVVEKIQNLSVKNSKELVVYLSMAFGNPYGENYHPDIVADLTEKLNQLDVVIIALSDTIGVSSPSNIAPLFSTLISEYPKIEFGAHFHTTTDKWEEKMDSAYQNGCKRFDSTIKGFGGCPMAKDELTGNMPTEKVFSFFKSKGIDLSVDNSAFETAVDNMSTYF
jgi:hydroxymethylglutaryl-CoA lyase